MESSHDDRQLKACLYFEAHRVISHRSQIFFKFLLTFLFFVFFRRTSKWQLRERGRGRGEGKRAGEGGGRDGDNVLWKYQYTKKASLNSLPTILMTGANCYTLTEKKMIKSPESKWKTVYLSLVSYNWTVLNQTGVSSDSVYSNSHRLLEGIILSYLFF